MSAAASAAGLLLAAALLAPLALAAGCLSRAFRSRVPGLLWLAPIPALLAAGLLSAGTAIAFPVPFRMTLALDQPGAILLGGAALLWSAAGAYAASYLRGKPGLTGFCVWWLLTLAGSLGVLIVADIAGFYLLFTLASLSAYGLVAHEQTDAARRAGLVYMVLALLGEAFLLFAFVMLAAGQPDPNPLIRDAVAALPGSPMRDGIAVLLMLGFALKMGLIPLHVWLPLAHPAAPMPASAVLSGVLVKAGVIGLIRFLPFESAQPLWGTVLATVGILTAFVGAALGVAQRRPKTILAYSTVSQMGLVAAILGAGLAAGDASAPGLAAYYGLHHTLVKGGLFLAVGVAFASGGAHRVPVLLLTGLLALSLAGLPLTSGALAKLAVKPMLGYGLFSIAVSLAAAGSTMLMLHFIAVMARETADNPAASAPLAETLPFLIVAAASFIIPWWLYPTLSGDPLASAWSLASLWKLVWPMMLGVAIFIGTGRFAGMAGRVPEGDILVLAERQAPRLAHLPAAIERLDGRLRLWPTAGLVLLCLVIWLGGGFLLAA
ncbi:complex I subunit 5 family protein [Bosea vaviloviae]|uniref:complex I subunit 5 family protein n=1 Tax=Bosea vaviloviae TaxID=1526658 RepID=UPI0006BB1676|nr:complex I subunit 5 family protein [Bosea vaviloviae]